MLSFTLRIVLWFAQGWKTTLRRCPHLPVPSRQARMAFVTQTSLFGVPMSQLLRGKWCVATRTPTSRKLLRLFSPKRLGKMLFVLRSRIQNLRRNPRPELCGGRQAIAPSHRFSLSPHTNNHRNHAQSWETQVYFLLNILHELSHLREPIPLPRRRCLLRVGTHLCEMERRQASHL